MSTPSLVRFFSLACGLTASLLLSSPARAQSRPPRTGYAAPTATRQQPPAPSSLTTRAGLAAAERLLSASSREDRVRGVQRIAALGDFAAAQTLVRACTDPSTSSLLFGDERIRLAAVRAVSPFAARDPVRDFLLRAMDGPRNDGAGLATVLFSDTAVRARDEAAMALAAADETRATEALLAAILSGSSAADAAAHALLAHPPSNFAPLLSKACLASPRVVELLGRIGDLRAIPKLRPLVDKGDLAVRTAAAVALARLGDEFPVVAGRKWLDEPGATPALRASAAEVLVRARAVEAPRAMAILLADPSTRVDALRFAFDAPTPQLSPSLAGYLTISPPPQRASTLLALARSGGPVAARTLDKMSGSAASPDPDALFAIAHLAGDDARRTLQRFAAQPTTRRLGARAALVRLAALADRIDGLVPLLESLLASPDPSDQAVGAQGLAMLGDRSVQDLVSSQSPAKVRGACRAALLLGPEASQACASLVRDNVPPAVRSAAAIVLMGDVEPSQLSAATLVSWAESADPLAVVYARALGARDDEALRPRLRLLLASGNALLRSQVALGLARSPSPSWVSLVVQSAEFELDPAVRRAMVRALSATTAPQRIGFLRETMRLDPDDTARELARLALAGVRLDRPLRGTRTAWISLSPNAPAARASLSRALIVVPASDFALGAISDEDGMVLLPGLPAGDMRIHLAPTAASPQAATP